MTYFYRGRGAMVILPLLHYCIPPWMQTPSPPWMQTPVPLDADPLPLDADPLPLDGYPPSWSRPIPLDADPLVASWMQNPSPLGADPPLSPCGQTNTCENNLRKLGLQAVITGQRIPWRLPLNRAPDLWFSENLDPLLMSNFHTFPRMCDGKDDCTRQSICDNWEHNQNYCEDT